METSVANRNPKILVLEDIVSQVSKTKEIDISMAHDSFINTDMAALQAIFRVTLIVSKGLHMICEVCTDKNQKQREFKTFQQTGYQVKLSMYVMK